MSEEQGIDELIARSDGAGRGWGSDLQSLASLPSHLNGGGCRPYNQRGYTLCLWPYVQSSAPLTCTATVGYRIANAFPIDVLSEK